MANPVGSAENRQRFRGLFVQSGFSFSCDESLIALAGLDIAQKVMRALAVRDKLTDLAWDYAPGRVFPAWWLAYRCAATEAVRQAKDEWDKWQKG